MRIEDAEKVRVMIRFYHALRGGQGTGNISPIYIPPAMWPPLRDHLIPLVEAFLREKGVEI